MRIAVLGSGSIGTILGSLLTKKGKDVLLIDTYKEHVDKMNRNGAKIIGKINETIPVKASLPSNIEGYFDIVFFTTKQMHIHAALDSILPHIKDDSIIVTLQNGIPEDEVKKRIDIKNIIGGSVGWGATFKEPGVSELTSDVSGMSITIGALNNEINEKVKKVESILKLIGDVIVSDNLLGTKWTKLIMNATSSGMSTVLGANFGEVADDFKSYTCEAYIAIEAAKVMEAANIKPIEFHGFFPSVEKINFNTKKDLEVLMPYFKNRIAKHRNLIASMLQDIHRGNKTEINQINGKIVEYGEKYKINTQFNKTVVDVVKKIEKDELKPDWSNLKYFDLSILN